MNILKAAVSNNISDLKKCLDNPNCDINERNNLDSTPLINAAYSGHIEWCAY